MKRKYKRLSFIAVAGVLIAAAATLILSAFEDNIVFFKSPGDIVSGRAEEGRRIRLGGLVVEDSIRHEGDGLVRFAITDTADTVAVEYVGILPDLFREGQGVVTEGRMQNGVFRADTVLAKHDENYMPAEVAEALKEAGRWQGNDSHSPEEP